MPQRIVLSHSTGSEEVSDESFDEGSYEGVNIRGPNSASASTGSAVDEEDDWEEVEAIQPSDSASRSHSTRRHYTRTVHSRPLRSRSSRRVPVSDPPAPPHPHQHPHHGRSEQRERPRRRRPQSVHSSEEFGVDDYPGYQPGAPPPPHQTHPTPEWSHVPRFPGSYAPTQMSYPNPFSSAYGDEMMRMPPPAHDPYYNPFTEPHNPLSPSSLGSAVGHGGYFEASIPRRPRTTHRHSMAAPPQHDVDPYAMTVRHRDPYGGYRGMPPPGWPYGGYPFPPPGHMPGQFSAPHSKKNSPEPPPPPPAPIVAMPPPAPSPHDDRIAKLEQLLIEQREREAQKEEAKRHEKMAALRAAEDAKKKKDEDKLEKLEKLILAQKNEQIAREKAAQARADAEKAEREAKDAKAAAEKAAAEENAKKLKEAADKAKKDAEEEAAKKAEEAKAEHEKALAEATKAKEEMEAKKKAAEDEAAALKPKPDEAKPPIKFKDAVGRKFSFPWHLCKTWKGMEDLIKQAFLHVDIIGPHVQEGHYDLMGPNGEILLPQVWEMMIQPDWNVTMHMWPMPEPPKREDDLMPPPPPPPPGTGDDLHDFLKGIGGGKKKKDKGKDKGKAHKVMGGAPIPPPHNFGAPIPPPPMMGGGMPEGISVVPEGLGPAGLAAYDLGGPGHGSSRRKKEQPIPPILRWAAGGGRAASVKKKR